MKKVNCSYVDRMARTKKIFLKYLIKVKVIYLVFVETEKRASHRSVLLNNNEEPIFPCQYFSFSYRNP